MFKDKSFTKTLALSPAILPKTRHSSKEFPPNPKLNETEPFRLCNFFWKQKDENQLELINE